MVGLNAVDAACPYCGEPITLLVDTSLSDQTYIEDCEVCCQPMVITAQVDDEQNVSLNTRREQD